MHPFLSPFEGVRQASREALIADDPETAIAKIENYLTTHPQDRRAHLDAQWLCERLYRFDESLVHARHALALAPEDHTPILQAAKMMFGRARFSESLALLREVIAPETPDATTLVRAGQVAERAGQLDAALDFAEAALHREPGEARAVQLIAHIERRRNELSSAHARLERRLAAGSFPDRWRLLYELAAVLDRIGDYRGAMKAIMEAKALLAPTTAQFAASADNLRQRQRDVIHGLTTSDYRRWAEQSSALPSQRLAVLAGHPRCGTTMLEQRLTASPDAIGTDESGVFNNEFATALLWDAAGPVDRLIEDWNSWSLDELEAGRDTFWNLTEAMLGERIGSRLLIEKDPVRTPDLPLFLRLFPETKILMPLRHPCDVALSVLMTLVPIGRTSWAANSLPAALQSIAHSLSCWRILREQLPQAWREVRYEDFTADPDAGLAEVRSFLELHGTVNAGQIPQDPAAPSHRGISTPSYLEAAGAIHRRSVGRWQHYAKYLAPHVEPHVRLFEEFGYSVS